jgi:hypothetical protein
VTRLPSPCLPPAADGDSNIVVLGEHTLFVLDLRGQVVAQKRLEYHPAACCCYPVPPVASAPGGDDNLLVRSQQHRCGGSSWLRCESPPAEIMPLLRAGGDAHACAAGLPRQRPGMGCAQRAAARGAEGGRPGLKPCCCSHGMLMATRYWQHAGPGAVASFTTAP